MISGEKRESTSFERKLSVGLFEGKVIAVNPNEEEFKEILGIELKEDSKSTEYLSEKDGVARCRVSVWLEEVKSGDKFNVNFFLENRERENKDMTKKQYINNIGICTWADDPNNLPDWFARRDYRVAMVGEEELYSFLRTWISGLDYSKDSAELQLDWKKLMRGNTKELREQIDGSWCGNVVALATVISKEKDGEVKEYQGVYNKEFLPPYTLKQFRLVDYSDSKVIANLKTKKPKDLKSHERFVLNVTGEYGVKDYFILKDLREYNPSENVVSNNNPITEDGTDY